MRNKKIIGIALLILIVVLLGCVSNEENKSTVGKPTSSVKGELEIVGKPLLNQNFKLVYKLSSMVDASDVITKITLPDNIELVSGNLEWNGDLKRDEYIELPPIELRVENIGQYDIKARVTNYFGEDRSGSFESHLDIVYIDVFENDTSISDVPPGKCDDDEECGTTRDERCAEGEECGSTQQV